MYSDLDPDPYLKGQGHTGQLNIRVHMFVSVLLFSVIGSDTYFEAQVHGIHLKVRVHMFVSAL